MGAVAAALLLPVVASAPKLNRERGFAAPPVAAPPAAPLAAVDAAAASRWKKDGSPNAASTSRLAPYAPPVVGEDTKGADDDEAAPGGGDGVGCEDPPLPAAPSSPRFLITSWNPTSNVSSSRLRGRV
jgi:hypothetical protein